MAVQGHHQTLLAHAEQYDTSSAVSIWDPFEELPLAPTAIGQLTWHISLANAANRRLDVRLDVPAGMGRVLLLPVWTPGSYMLREYAQYVFDVRAKATNGQVIPIHKVSKNRWQLDEVHNEEGYHVWYTVAAHVFSVRTNYCEADWAHLIGAATYLIPTEQLQRQEPLHVHVWLPQNWQAHSSLPLTALPGLGQSKAGVLRGVAATAPNYDTLLDSPWLLGTTTSQSFQVAGIEHEIISCGQYQQLDLSALPDKLHAIVSENYAFWQRMPYSHYQFMLIWQHGYGGLEHRDCSVMVMDPVDWQQVSKRGDLYALLAHEHFHAWNGKRLRPIALGPFDYERENYTPSLWVVEGITSYFDMLQACRVDCITPEDFLSAWSKVCQGVLESTAANRHSLVESSLDAWIKFYRLDGYSQAYVTNYYSKGAVVAWVLDGLLRQLTQDKLHLQHALQVAFTRFSEHTGYQEQQWRALLSELAGSSLQQFFAAYVDGTAPLPVAATAAFFGCIWQPMEQPMRDGGCYYQGVSGLQQALGCSFERHASRLIISKVREGGFAYGLGLQPGDVLLGIDKVSLCGRSSEQYAGVWRQEEPHRLLWTRGGLLVERQAPWAQPMPKCQLVIDVHAEGSAKRRLQRWLQSSGNNLESSNG